MSKKPTIAQLLARIAELEAELGRFTNSVSSVTTSTTDVGLTRYNIAGIKKDAMSHTPDAVDAIRLYTWPQMAKGVEKKAIVASLISQGFNKATVRARVNVRRGPHGPLRAARGEHDDARRARVP